MADQGAVTSAPSVLDSWFLFSFLFEKQHEKMRHAYTFSGYGDWSPQPFEHSIYNIPYNAFGALVLHLGCICESPKDLLKAIKAKPHQRDSDLIGLG